MSETRFLEGIVVLDFSTVGPAARCSRILADYGADVVVIGAPPRRGGVQIEPPFYAYGARRGMRRTCLDLKDPRGRATFLRLAAGADVVIESYRPGTSRRLGIAYADVARVNPGIVYCSTSGYGQDGPRAQWAGHDLNYLALGGFLDCSGRRADGGPALPGTSIADAAAGGMQAAIAILAALQSRGRSSEGAYLDVSVIDGVLHLMSLPIDQYLATGEEARPGHDILTGRYACYELYCARDGRWLAVAAIEPAFWANLCRALELERWIPHQTDDDRQDEIRSDLRTAFAGRDRDEWIAELAPADTCVSAVHSVAELVGDPQLAHRGAFVDVAHERHGPFRQLGPVLAGATRAAGAHAVRDSSATDTDELLGAAGLSRDEIEELRRGGVVA